MVTWKIDALALRYGAACLSVSPKDADGFPRNSLGLCQIFLPLSYVFSLILPSVFHSFLHYPIVFQRRTSGLSQSCTKLGRGIH